MGTGMCPEQSIFSEIVSIAFSSGNMVEWDVENIEVVQS